MTIEAGAWTIENDDLQGLLRRQPALSRQLIRRALEEQIAALVPVQAEPQDQRRQQWLAGRSLEAALKQERWTEADLELNLHLGDALERFAHQRFGPGLEESFLSSQGGRDQIVYSMIRSRDPALIRELWIRLEEAETTFAEAASQFSEGPEKARKGVMGPLAIGTLHPPELANRLRDLAPGQLAPPWQLGEWHLLLRLEELTPARFDEHTRTALLKDQLEKFLTDRVESTIAGENLEPLHFDVDG